MKFVITIVLDPLEHADNKHLGIVNLIVFGNGSYTVIHRECVTTKLMCNKESSQSTGTSGVEMPSDSLLWVDKYKPQSLKQIIGQLGEKSNVRKLLNWLTNWHRNVASGKKPACE